jgi:hypothetical protein
VACFEVDKGDTAGKTREHSLQDRSLSFERREFFFCFADFLDLSADNGFTMKLKDYFQYAAFTPEHNPIYLFDGDVAEKAPELVSDYQVPPYFQEDLFSLLGEKDRPSYRFVYSFRDCG